MSNSTPAAMVNAVQRSVRQTSAPTGPGANLSKAPVRLASRRLDPLLANLSPATILEELCGASNGDLHDDDSSRMALRASIAQASSAERAFGTEAALASSKVRLWHDEIQGWEWPSSSDGTTGEGFEVPTIEARARRRPESKDRNHHAGSSDPIMEELVGEEACSLDEPYWGSLPAREVLEHETRLEFIKASIDDLNMDRLKARVLDVHVPSRSRPPSQAGFDNSHMLHSNYRHLDSFTAVTTATILHALPYLYRLVRLLEVWGIRFAVLRRVPSFLNALEATQNALWQGWQTLERSPSTLTSSLVKLGVMDRASSHLSKSSVEAMRLVLEGQIKSLGTEMDCMLDTLEGREDTVPDKWLAALELLEQDYAEWAVVAQEGVVRLESEFPEDAQSVSAHETLRNDKRYSASGKGGMDAPQQLLLDDLHAKAPLSPSAEQQDSPKVVDLEATGKTPGDITAADVSVSALNMAPIPKSMSRFSSPTNSERDTPDGEAQIAFGREKFPSLSMSSQMDGRLSKDGMIEDRRLFAQTSKPALPPRLGSHTSSRRSSVTRDRSERPSARGLEGRSRADSQTSDQTIGLRIRSTSASSVKRALSGVPPSTESSRPTSTKSGVSRPVSVEASRRSCTASVSGPSSPYLTSPPALSSLGGFQESDVASIHVLLKEAPSPTPIISERTRALTSRFSIKPAPIPTVDAVGILDRMRTETSREVETRPAIAIGRDATPNGESTRSSGSVLKSEFSARAAARSISDSFDQAQRTDNFKSDLNISSTSAPTDLMDHDRKSDPSKLRHNGSVALSRLSIEAASMSISASLHDAQRIQSVVQAKAVASQLMSTFPSTDSTPTPAGGSKLASKYNVKSSHTSIIAYLGQAEDTSQDAAWPESADDPTPPVHDPALTHRPAQTIGSSLTSKYSVRLNQVWIVNSIDDASQCDHHSLESPGNSNTSPPSARPISGVPDTPRVTSRTSKLTSRFSALITGAASLKEPDSPSRKTGRKLQRTNFQPLPLSSSGAMEDSLVSLRLTEATLAQVGEANEDSRFSETSADVSSASDSISELSSPELADASADFYQAQKAMIMRPRPANILTQSSPINHPRLNSRSVSMSAESVPRNPEATRLELLPMQRRARARTTGSGTTTSSGAGRLQKTFEAFEDTISTTKSTKRASITSFEVLKRGEVKAIEVKRSRHDSEASSTSTPLPQRPRSSYLRTPPSLSAWNGDNSYAVSPRLSAALASLALHDAVDKVVERQPHSGLKEKGDGFHDTLDALTLPSITPDHSDRRTSHASVDRISSHTFGDPEDVDQLPEEDDLSGLNDEDPAEESDLLADPTSPPSPALPTNELEKKISSILNTVPIRIRLASKPISQIPVPKFHPKHIVDPSPAFAVSTPPHRSTSNPSPRDSTSSTSSIPIFTLAPAQTPGPCSTSSYSGRNRLPLNSSLSSNSKSLNSASHSEIRLYHLSRASSTEAPLKLFVRAVGESGECVMVRVGGGWADLGDYLREYASHHGRSGAASDSQIELHDLPTPSASSATSSANHTPTHSTITATTSTNAPGTTSSYRSTSIRSRPGSAFGLGRPSPTPSTSTPSMTNTRRVSGPGSLFTSTTSPSSPSFYTTAATGTSSLSQNSSHRTPPSVPPMNSHARVLSWSHMADIPSSITTSDRKPTIDATKLRSALSPAPGALGLRIQKRTPTGALTGTPKSKRGVSLDARTTPDSADQIPTLMEDTITSSNTIHNSRDKAESPTIRTDQAPPPRRGLHFGEMQKVAGVTRLYRRAASGGQAGG